MFGDQGPQQTVLFRSDKIPEGTPTVKGYDFNKGLDYDALFASLKSTGFQATEFGRAIEEIKSMIKWRQSDEPLKEGEEEDPMIDRSKIRTTIFLGYTSNMISSGVREVIRYLCQHKMVDCIVSTAGGIEEDFMKILEPHYLGDWHLPGKELRIRGYNRIGNLLVPNLNYCVFEEFITPVLDAAVVEQEEKGVYWTPSKLINRLGKEIEVFCKELAKRPVEDAEGNERPRTKDEVADLQTRHEQSVYYWCWKNNIPVFSPALVDGSIGDMIYFHGQIKNADGTEKPRLRLDICDGRCRFPPPKKK